MARLLDDPKPSDPSVPVAQLAVDGIFVGPGLGPSAARGVAKGVLAYALARMDPPARGLLVTWLALMGLSR
jgi:hypothetical protein